MSEDKIVINNNTSSGGIGFSGLLTIIFVFLKLFGVIDWSWVWVLSPLWISIAIFFAVLVVLGTIVFVILLVGSAASFVKEMFNRK